MANAATKETFCRLPVEYVLPGLSQIEIKAVDKLRAVRVVDAWSDIAKQFQDLGAGKVRPQCDVGRHIREVAVRPSDVTAGDTKDLGIAAARAKKAEQNANRRGLSRAVGAEEAEHLARCDGQGQVVDGDDVAEPLGQTVDADC